MADIEQVSFSHEELIEVLIRETKITEGKWSLNVNLGVNIGGFAGQSEGKNTVAPGVLILIQKIGIQRTVEPIAPGAIVVDAATVNPKKAS